MTLVGPIGQNSKEYHEVLIETFLRKEMRLKAHTVTHVEQTEEAMEVSIDQLGKRLLRCGVCRQRCQKVHDVMKKEREWRRSEEHTSELQSPCNLVCRLLLE